jgi:hypothetical protein
MKRNENPIDRIIRVLFGTTLGALVAFKVVTGTAAVALGVVGGILIVTGLVGVCGIYAILGLSTCKVPGKC